MPEFTVPESWGSLREENTCHNPGGSPQGGQFCSRSATKVTYNPPQETRAQRAGPLSFAFRFSGEALKSRLKVDAGLVAGRDFQNADEKYPDGSPVRPGDVVSVEYGLGRGRKARERGVVIVSNEWMRREGGVDYPALRVVSFDSGAEYAVIRPKKLKNVPVPEKLGWEWEKTVEVNRCHGPGRGHPCTGQATAKDQPKPVKSGMEPTTAERLPKKGSWFHVTSDPFLILDPSRKPRVTSDSGLEVVRGRAGLFLTQFPHVWHKYRGARNYALEVVPRAGAGDTTSTKSGERFVSTQNARVVAVWQLDRQGFPAHRLTSSDFARLRKGGPRLPATTVGGFSEVNRCHGPGRGHPCTGGASDEVRRYNPNAREEAKGRLAGRAAEAGSLLQPLLPGSKVKVDSTGFLHRVYVTDPDGTGTHVDIDVARADQPWDRVQVGGVYGGVGATFRWKHGKALNAKGVAGAVRSILDAKREYHARLKAGH